ncbi:4242_t:CDS:2 [Ambispora gerdemannii]|uniref:4242_t:CDS:1 n=1 Tax=Ambispora gerdemannii TaxID=144530 RepID=A0A9N8W565_9GLOM|nr:4242_t:CDS:2 [Ambispora gerdemannii]
MKSSRILALFAFVSISAVKTHAWGAQGHITVGNIAQKILKPDVALKVKQIFQEKKYNGQLGPASTWADEVKRGKNEFAGWSAPLHYMDTHDDPGNSCSVDKKKDCPDGQCIVGAIANYTEQLDCGNGGSVKTRDVALRFLAHFFGDITQPLHVCGRELGGNQHKIMFDGKQSNLHSIWDTGMVVKRLKDFGNDENKYAEFLTNEIQKGSYAKNVSDWIACESSKRRRDFFDNAFFQKRAEAESLRCPFVWATDTNSVNCEVVWQYVDDNPDVDLSEEYYSAVQPIIDIQIAKGGYRLGVFLNNLLDDKKCSKNNAGEKGE